MKKKCLAHQDCPIARGYGAVGDWWSLLIVTQVLLHGGTSRFGEIQCGLGVAKNILTARLRKLVEDGILVRIDGETCGYGVTEKGRDLYKLIVALRQWGEKYYYGDKPKTNELVDRETGKPIPPIEVRAADGRVLGPDDLVVVCRKGRADADVKGLGTDTLPR